MDNLMPRTIAQTHHQRTNVTLPDALLHEARALKINLSQACARGLALEVAETKAAIWRQENADAMASWNEHVEHHGLPLAEFRSF
jgi:antitoxin CcdA